MSNPQDVSLFEQGVDVWNAALEDRLYGTGRRSREGPPADLSHEQLGRRAVRRIGLDDRPSLDSLVSYPRAEFAFCDLQGTDFRLPVLGYDFRAANFFFADLRGTNFHGADLQSARFRDAKLTDATLSGTRLDSAELDSAELTGTDLSYAAPWRASLFPHAPPKPPLVPSEATITSVSDLIRLCGNLREQAVGSALRFYFRGEIQSWKLRPSVLRSLRLRRTEGAMLTELMTARPQDFTEHSLALEQWVLAQHHELRTRLLDVTRNPLAALFFACEPDLDSNKEDGRLHVFAVPPSLIKPYDSDSVSIIANFAKLSFAEQSTLLGKRREVTGNYQRAMAKLYHLIGQEKPHFRQAIDPRDLFRVFVVEPRRSFDRISAQAGAFLLSAFHERLEASIISRYPCRTPVYQHLAWTIPASAKTSIVKELSMLNVTRPALFPELTTAAGAITDHHRSASNSDPASRHVSHPTWAYRKRELPPDRTPRILDLAARAQDQLDKAGD